jgi:hypothetical protein
MPGVGSLLMSMNIIPFRERAVWLDLITLNEAANLPLERRNLCLDAWC